MPSIDASPTLPIKHGTATGRLVRRIESLPTSPAFLAAAAVALFLYQIYIARDVWFRPGVYGDGIQFHVYFLDPLGLGYRTRDDLFGEYVRWFSPVGYFWLLDWPARLGISPLHVAWALMGPVWLAFLAGAYAMGARGAGKSTLREARAAGLLTLLLVLVANDCFYNRASQFEPRSFSYFSAAWFLWALLARRFKTALAIAAGVSLFYYQSYVLLFATLGTVEALRLARRAWERGPLKPGILRLVAIGIAGAVCAAPIQYRSNVLASKYGALYLKSDIEQLPEYKPGGRYARERAISLSETLAMEFGQKFIRNDDESFRLDARLWAAILLYGSFAYCAARLWVRDRERFVYRGPMFVYFGVGLALFEIAGWTLPRLHYPNRYIRGALPLIAFAFLSANLVWWSRGLASGALSVASRWARGAWMVACAVVFAGIFSTEPHLGHSGDVRRIDPAVLHLRTLDEHLTVAAYPENEADRLSLVIGQRVYVSKESYNVFFKSLTEEMRRRLWVLLPALYPLEGAKDVEPLAAEGVDFLLVNKSTLQKISSGKSKPPAFHVPYRAWIQERLTPANARQILEYWKTQTDWKVEFESKDYLLIDLRRSPPPA